MSLNDEHTTGMMGANKPMSLSDKKEIVHATGQIDREFFFLEYVKGAVAQLKEDVNENNIDGVITSDFVLGVIKQRFGEFK